MPGIFLRGEFGGSFAWQTDIENLEPVTTGKQPTFDIGDIITSVGDAISEEDNPADSFKRCGGGHGGKKGCGPYNGKNQKLPQSKR
jgi:hypothetical protein